MRRAPHSPKRRWCGTRRSPRWSGSRASSPLGCRRCTIRRGCSGSVTRRSGRPAREGWTCLMWRDRGAGQGGAARRAAPGREEAGTEDRRRGGVTRSKREENVMAEKHQHPQSGRFVPNPHEVPVRTGEAAGEYPGLGAENWHADLADVAAEGEVSRGLRREPVSRLTSQGRARPAAAGRSRLPARGRWDLPRNPAGRRAAFGWAPAVSRAGSPRPASAPAAASHRRETEHERRDRRRRESARR